MKYFIYASTISIFGIFITIIFTLYTGLSSAAFTGDIFLIADFPPYVGFLSNIGAFAWFSAFTINIFTLVVLVKLHDYEYFDFLNSSAIFTFILFFDDFFMMHDYWLRLYFGKFDLIFYIVLGMIFISYLYYFRKILMSGNYHLLATSIIFFGFSIVFDIFQEEMQEIVGTWQYLIEDGVKWIGICFWVAYYFDFCVDKLQNKFQEN